ncbi:ADP-ribosylglycohydrolase family protein [Paenibacillus soyae]|uniref:ADP-ribosylglycohydrolase family protein n=1 Tax=Paenibacillus soyae TaxID=2969249 RepID=A0A9X2MM48_9BACL|nr:ADP-ribosylglycohydrolase family protein [Paenibacillus soyae]MCR2802780.1 ADP-ribosylglycohydrolase family protein [Paenibacillus soyae]
MSQVRAGILGLCVGDALGVPVEFRAREALVQAPVTDMREYGSHHQPAGTWSDDSSMVFCQMESMIGSNGIDMYDTAHQFTRWYDAAFWTPHGKVFDIGIATRRAIDRLMDEFIRPDLAGGSDEYSNGNGSLMRILPLAYELQRHPVEARIQAVKQISSITHRHSTSVIGCVIYVELALSLLQGLRLEEGLLQIKDTIPKLFAGDESLKHYDRILKEDLGSLPESAIQSTGYVVHTLEASLWCLLTTNDYSAAVLKAVNLGEDTDTTGAVAGGLAGLMYGEDSIPENWIQQLARKADVLDLCERFEQWISRVE